MPFTTPIYPQAERPQSPQGPNQPRLASPGNLQLLWWERDTCALLAEGVAPEAIAIAVDRSKSSIYMALRRIRAALGVTGEALVPRLRELGYQNQQYLFMEELPNGDPMYV